MLVSTTRRFCVYAHSIAGKVFYIGKGPPDRAFSLRSRSKRWREKVGDQDFDVVFMGRYATDVEAREAEKSAIMSLKPECNLMHNGWGMSEGQKQALSRVRKGVARRPDARQRMREGWDKAFAEGRSLGVAATPIACVETGEVFRSMSHAAAKMGLDRSSVRLCITGKRMSTGGYSFKKADTNSASPSN